MSWTYEQKTGRLWHDDEFVSIGYSGHGEGVDNPEDEGRANVGPLPEGTYTIGAGFYDPKTGPLSLPLTQIAGVTFGRSAFLIHGDNQALNHTASEGCIILPHSVRLEIDASTDRTLIVTAGVTRGALAPAA
jgi:Protein of unknown function (DUF2778)